MARTIQIADSPRRFVKMFEAQFAPLVAAGTKRQTIRRTPKRLPKTGDIIDCRQWIGVPYRSGSKQRRLGEFVVTQVGTVTITGAFARIAFSDHYEAKLNGPEAHGVFAKADGFDSWEAMTEWCSKRYGLPFKGVLIQWREPST